MALEIEQVVHVLMADRNRLLAYIWSITGDFNLGEDVVQDVAMLAMAKGREVADESRLRVWLRRTARFKALEALRAKGRAPCPLSEEVLDKLDQHWEPCETLAESTVVGMLRVCFHDLTDAQRRLLSLRYTHGLSSSEIAERLDMKVETVYRAITRAHRSLSDCVQGKLTSEKQEDSR